jgi:hypothetical protein
MRDLDHGPVESTGGLRRVREGIDTSNAVKLTWWNTTPSRDARGRAVSTVATRRSYVPFGSKVMIVSISSSAVICHLSHTRWPLDSRPAMPWALVSSNAP